MKDTKGLVILLLGTVVILGALTLFTKNPQGQSALKGILPQVNNSSSPTPTSVPNLKEITIGSTTIMVNVANTEATRSKGLGGVMSMPEEQGMLFVFDKKNLSPTEARFWMKGMQIPLDFIWIFNNKVSEITPNVPAPAANTPDKDLKIYSPDASIDYVLEVNAGFAVKNNIKVGDNVTLNL